MKSCRRNRHNPFAIQHVTKSNATIYNQPLGSRSIVRVYLEEMDGGKTVSVTLIRKINPEKRILDLTFITEEMHFHGDAKNTNRWLSDLNRIDRSGAAVTAFPAGYNHPVARLCLVCL